MLQMSENTVKALVLGSNPHNPDPQQIHKSGRYQLARAGLYKNCPSTLLSVINLLKAQSEIWTECMESVPTGRTDPDSNH